MARRGGVRRGVQAHGLRLRGRQGGDEIAHKEPAWGRSPENRGRRTRATLDALAGMAARKAETVIVTEEGVMACQLQCGL